MKAKALKINKSTVTDILRSSLIAVIVSLVLVLVLALIVKFTGIGNSVILPVNQVIKIVSILVGCLLGIKTKEAGILKGAVSGLLFTLISVFVFLIINKTLDGNSFSFMDFVAGIVAGAVSGIIAVNFKKK